MSAIHELRSTANKEVFNKKVLSTIPRLHPYVKHRIYIGESTGILPKNMYSANGIIDECIIELYSNAYNIEADVTTIKLDLFRLADIYLQELFKKEAFHKDTTSTEGILQYELSRLNEDFTVDADLDLILNTELSDISYKQREQDALIYLYSDKESSFLNTFDIKDLSKSRAPEVVQQFYSWLPPNISSIFDMFLFGKLSFEEIAQVKNQTPKRISSIFEKVKKSFRSHLD